jgi:hypothetical protein
MRSLHPAIAITAACIALAACSTQTDESAPGGLFHAAQGGRTNASGGSSAGGKGSGAGGATSSAGAGGTFPACSVPAWEPSKAGAPAYAAGSLVSYQGKVYSVDHDLSYAHESCPPAGPERQTWCDGQYDYTYVRDC